MKFREFWPLYLRAHRRPATRGVHYLATGAGIIAAVVAMSLREPGVLIGVIVACYAAAIASHRFLEGNQPLILVNPIWDAVADLRMSWLAATGRIGAEFAKYEIAAAVAPSPSALARRALPTIRRTISAGSHRSGGHGSSS
jgi:hypothetical protein